MTYLLLGIGLFLLVAVLLNWAANAPPRALLNSGKWIFGIVAALLGLALIATGRFGLLWMVAVGLLPWLSRFMNLRRMWKTMQGPSQGSNSSVRSRFFAMTLDHQSGRMDGEILEGRFQGRNLSDLGQEDLVALYDEIRTQDRKSADLLEAYIDRVHGMDWRNGDTSDTSSPGSGEHRRQSGSSGGMARAEALAVLGLKEGCTPDEIRDAHKRMMKSAHPDAGGSDYLAAKVNEAKDVLLGKARR